MAFFMGSYCHTVNIPAISCNMIVGRTKTLEWRCLDAISALNHDQMCIWRNTNTTDLDRVKATRQLCEGKPKRKGLAPSTVATMQCFQAFLKIAGFAWFVAAKIERSSEMFTSCAKGAVLRSPTPKRGSSKLRRGVGWICLRRPEIPRRTASQGWLQHILSTARNVTAFKQNWLRLTGHPSHTTVLAWFPPQHGQEHPEIAAWLHLANK